MPSALIISDNFWLGGRETFIGNYLTLLDKQKHSLLANSIKGQYVDKVFLNHLSLQDKLVKDSLHIWLEQGAAWIAQQQPDFIWVHHYKILPAYLLSCIHKLPLHVTVHGPILSVGKMIHLQDLIGLTLAIHRGAIVSAVSEEIKSQLTQIGADRNKVHLLPNKLILNDSVASQTLDLAKNKTLKLVMLSRQQKLEHIRQAIRLLYAIRQQGQSAELLLHVGFQPEETTTGKPLQQSLKQRIQALFSLLGRRWLLTNPHLLIALPFIKVKPLTSQPQKVIDSADVVLGMGRVILEGLSLAKPSILIGYEKVIDLVDVSNIETLRTSNFSGRGLETSSCSVVAEKLLQRLSNPDTKTTAELQAKVDIQNSSERVQQIENLLNKPENHLSLTKDIGVLIQDLGLFEEDENDKLTDFTNYLSPAERATLDKLKALGEFV